MDILCNKKGLIFGAFNEHSLAWHTALRCIEEGAKIVLTNTSKASELGIISKLAAEHHIPFIVCDATHSEEIQNLLMHTQEILGGQIDFILHAVAQSVNLRRHKKYEQANYNYFLQTLDISALSLHKILNTSLKIDAIAPNGSVVTLSYIAAERYCDGYNDMSDAKALLENIARQFGAIYAQHNGVRINIVSQSPTPTKASGTFNNMDYWYRYTDMLSPLGNATADDCANVCIALFSDLMRSITMQTIYSDGGFGRTLLTQELMEKLKDKI